MDPHHHRHFLFLVLALLCAVSIFSCFDGSGGLSSGGSSTLSVAEAATGHCIDCHQGIETAHERFELGCATCHGGDPTATTKEEAHVQPKHPLPPQPTILPADYDDLEYLRFLNPTNLRVVMTTCGQSGAGLGASCHAQYAKDLFKSMMATTTGHLAGGAYENGLLPDRTAIWGNMPVEDLDGDIPEELGALPRLDTVPGEITSFPFDSFQRHYSDAPRKICVRCHLWSRGNAVRGVPGKEGGYRSEGCAACHVEYTYEALSESADPTIPKDEVGHPKMHRISTRMPSEQCRTCHYRGARIGLSYFGMAQLPPGTPAGEGYAGISPETFVGAWHYQNPAVNPPDIHMERGMACIDCHVRQECMGDGNIYGQMDRATRIECEDCHGTPTEYGSMETFNGIPHNNLRWEDGQMLLRGKISGRDHVVPQVKDIVNPEHPSYNATAATAMTGDHLKSSGGLECYACHSGWQNNCYGCHFSRDLRQNALDMITGEMTFGKPDTSMKYFVNFKNFHMGYNSEGKVGPWTVGCQVMATVYDVDGTEILHQEMPITAAGRSGLSMNPVQTHTVRPTPRFCVECHRNPSSLGLGTESFNLSRDHLFVLTENPEPGLGVVYRRDMSDPQVVSTVSGLSDPRALRVYTDPITAEAVAAYACDGDLGLVIYDLSDPADPSIAGTLDIGTCFDAAFAGDTLWVAAGTGGLLTYDISDPLQPALVSSLATTNARAVAVHGLYVLVADGAAGLRVVDVRDRSSPVIAATLDLNGADTAPNQALDVFPFAHFGNPPLSGEGVQPFQILAYIADGTAGVRIVDLESPESPELLGTIATDDSRRVFAKIHYVAGDMDTPSEDKEFLWVADYDSGLRLFDITDPTDPVELGGWTPTAPVFDFAVANAFEPPEQKLYVYIPQGSLGVLLLDWSDIEAPVELGSVSLDSIRGIDIEKIALDQMVDLDGIQIKDTSHDGARTFTREEIERILGADF